MIAVLLLLAAQTGAAAAPPTGQLVTAPMVDRTPLPPELFARAVPARSLQPLASYVTDGDYPALASRQGEEGLVEFALRVGADGRPAGCSVLNRGASLALELATCGLLTSRARFAPARDEKGKPVEGAVRGRIKWVLPPPAPVPERVTIRHRIRADGNATDCVMETVTGGKVERREAAWCEDVRTPADVLAAMRAQSSLPEPFVRTEIRLLTSAAEPWPDFREKGTRLVARSQARLVVEQGGKVSLCSVVETHSLIGRSPNPCRPTMVVEAKGLSLPSEVRMVMAVVLENEPEQ